jgi:hypothetical protein
MKITSQQIKEEFEKNGVMFVNRSFGLTTTTMTLDTLTKVINKLVTPLLNTVEDFGVGNKVNVKKLDNDMFNHDFTGTVVEVNPEYVVVEDQDGDCWSCDPKQLTHNSDEHMHD